MISPVLVYLALASLAYIVYQTISARGKRLPPGPKGYPIIGNLLDVANLARPAETYTKWAETYGEVISFTTYGQTSVILNSAKAAIDILERRSHAFSNRPRFIYVNEMMRWDWEPGHLQYGDEWRFHRRVMHQYFQPSALPDYHELQIRAGASLMGRLQKNPEDFYKHLRSEFGRGILKAVYGYEAKLVDDPFVALSDQAAMYLGTAMQPGRFLADYFEFLKFVPGWFPGTFYKQYAEEGAAHVATMRNTAYEVTKAAIADGTAGHSFVRDALTRYDDVEDKQLVETAVKSNAASALVAGADTTTSASMTFILAMCLHPEIQRKAHEEMDRVVGPDTMPTFADRENLPYLEAAIVEAFRWFVIAPLGAIPHSSLEDEEYNGFIIPKGASVFPNVWAITHDPKLYPEPHTFNPERFYPTINKDAENINPDPRQFTFGLGRRMCPGRHFAQDALWSVMAHLIACYDILPSLDANGKEVPPVADWTGGAASFPTPYTVRFVARSEEKAKLVASRYAEVNEL